MISMINDFCQSFPYASTRARGRPPACASHFFGLIVLLLLLYYYYCAYYYYNYITKSCTTSTICYYYASHFFGLAVIIQKSLFRNHFCYSLLTSPLCTDAIVSRRQSLLQIAQHARLGTGRASHFFVSDFYFLVVT